MTDINDLFGKELNVLNLGLASMSQSVKAQGVKVTDVDWQPPREDYSQLSQTKGGINIDEANQEVIKRICRGQPVLVGMGIAQEVIPGMHAQMILHAGPPIEWERMCGPTRGAVMGALIYEGMAQDEQEALVQRKGNNSSDHRERASSPGFASILIRELPFLEF